MKRLLLMFFLLTACIGCDQSTKAIATQTLSGRAPLSFLGDTVRLQYARNPGAFLGLGADLPPAWRFGIFTAANGLLLLGLLVYLFKRKDLSMVSFIALGLVIAGGIGNLIDRFGSDGRVVDFINLGIGRSFRTGIFNVADVAIMAGGILLLFAERKRRPSAQEA